MDMKEIQTDSKLIYDGIIVHLYRDGVLLPDGKSTVREVVRHVGAVCVVPLTEKNEVVCVRQFRYPHNDILLEIPAGKLDSKNEDHRSAALRELKEETGYSCGRLEYIGALYTSPAILDEIIYMYVATELTAGSASPDEDEFIECEKIPIEDMVKMIMRGEIPDSKTQTAVLKAYYMLHNGFSG